MTKLAIILILAVAATHALWNLLAKKVSGVPAFVRLFNTCSAIIYVPLAFFVILWQKPEIVSGQLVFMLGSML